MDNAAIWSRIRAGDSVHESTGDHPVIWTNDRLKARNLHIFMGHHPNLFANAAYTTLLTNSIMWLANKPATTRP